MKRKATERHKRNPRFHHDLYCLTSPILNDMGITLNSTIFTPRFRATHCFPRKLFSFWKYFLSSQVKGVQLRKKASHISIGSKITKREKKGAHMSVCLSAFFFLFFFFFISILYVHIQIYVYLWMFFFSFWFLFSVSVLWDHRVLQTKKDTLRFIHIIAVEQANEASEKTAFKKIKKKKCNENSFNYYLMQK